MKILNLVYPEISDIKYKPLQFPDGQQDIIINNKLHSITNDVFSYLKENDVVEIRSRFNSFKDLELIICAVRSLQRLEIDNIHLYIPYLLGARSDRQFQEGGTSYLVDVVAPILNNLNLKSITFFDPHSDVSMGVIKKSKLINNSQLVKWALPQIDNTFSAQENVAIVSPDGGALKKIYETTTSAKLNCDIILSAKHRDVFSGKLKGFYVPLEPHQINKTLVWVDDICSGGGTFMGEAQVAIDNGHLGDRYLIVSHYENTADIDKLSKYFKNIFTTNSICDIENDYIKQLNIF